MMRPRATRRRACSRRFDTATFDKPVPSEGRPGDTVIGVAEVPSVVAGGAEGGRAATIPPPACLGGVAFARLGGAGIASGRGGGGPGSTGSGSAGGGAWGGARGWAGTTGAVGCGGGATGAAAGGAAGGAGRG